VQLCIVPVCPHAGGVGLCELVQHLSIFDYISIAKTTENRCKSKLKYINLFYISFSNNRVSIWNLCQMYGEGMEGFSSRWCKVNIGRGRKTWKECVRDDIGLQITGAKFRNESWIELWSVENWNLPESPEKLTHTKWPLR